MKTDDIRSMAQALKSVREAKKMDPVDKKDALGKYKNRDDKDIDNDGDTDSSDRYLHNRRKAVTKAVMKGKRGDKDQTNVEIDVQEGQQSWRVEHEGGVHTVKAQNEKQAKNRALSKARIAKGARSQRMLDKMKATPVNEEAEELDELSRDTVDSYFKKALKQRGDLQHKSNEYWKAKERANKKLAKTGKTTNIRKPKPGPDEPNTIRKRSIGTRLAMKRLTKDQKESTFLDRYKARLYEGREMKIDLIRQKIDSGLWEAVDELRPNQHVEMKDTASGSHFTIYVAEAQYSTTGKEPMHTVDGPARSVQPSKEVRQSREVSSTPDTSKLQRGTRPKANDGVHAIKYNDNAENQSQKDAVKKGMKENVDSFDDAVAASKSAGDGMHTDRKAMDTIAGYMKKGMSYPDAKIQSGQESNTKYGKKNEAAKEPYAIGMDKAKKMYDDEPPLEKKTIKKAHDIAKAIKRDESVDHEVRESRFGGVRAPETRKPMSIRDALAMMENRAAHYRGATPPQPYLDQASGSTREFVNKHRVEMPDEANIDAVHAKNTQEIDASLQRSVDYRHNDQPIGDKKPVRNDGK